MTKRVTCCFLFADVAGFSRLSGKMQLDEFARSIMKPVASLIEDSGDAILEYNTWGDGLFVVFRTASAGCQFALRLRDQFRQDYRRSGMAVNVNVRCALHLGEMACHENLLPGGRAFIVGDDVTFTARIEPIVRPGEIWATTVVAAALERDVGEDIKFDHLGAAKLAKDYGETELLGVRWAQDAPIASIDAGTQGGGVDPAAESAIRSIYRRLLDQVPESVRPLVVEFYEAVVDVAG
jgi:class 3 adenylate cyclase